MCNGVAVGGWDDPAKCRGPWRFCV